MYINYPYYTDSELSKRGYNYFLELYPDADNYNCKNILDLIELDAIADDGDVKQFAYILHDKEDAKPHYHLAVKFKTNMRLKDFLNRYGLWNYNPNGNNIIVGKSNKKMDRWIGCLNYLIHNTRDSLEKYQYSEDEVISNIPDTIQNLRISKDNIDIFDDIVDFITDENNRITYKKVIEFCRKRDRSYIRVFLDRTNNFVFTNLIKERNRLL